MKFQPIILCRIVFLILKIKSEGMNSYFKLMVTTGFALFTTKTGISIEF